MANNDLNTKAAKIAAILEILEGEDTTAAEEAAEVENDEELELEESSRSSYQKDAESGAI